MREARSLAAVMVLASLSSACWLDGRQICHLQGSTNAEYVFDRDCDGVVTDFVARGCAQDETWYPLSECESSCASVATCELKEQRAVEGSCTATICGS